MASAGLSPFGHAFAQFMMVWHRYRRNGSSRLSSRGLVAAILYPASCLQQRRRTEKTFAIPPVARAGSRATSAKDAFVESVELFSILRTLQPLLLWRRTFGLEPWFNGRKLGVKVGKIGDKG